MASKGKQQMEWGGLNTLPPKSGDDSGRQDREILGMGPAGPGWGMLPPCSAVLPRACYARATHARRARIPLF